MQVAIANHIEGIVAECGGNCACGTCHVYVAEADLRLLPPPSEVEHAMLDATAAERKDTSRLSCQIRLTSELDSIVVELPPFQ
jgi:ferredoxin, 2Fe-2S